MKQIQMEANLRKATGKGPMGRLRKQGIVPAVLYGKSETSVNLEVNMKEVNQAIHTSAGTNILVKLNIQGGEAPKEETVMIKALQRHPVTSQLVHVDLIKVSMDKPLETSIPVIISGIARGIKEGGILEVVHREIAIRCLPALIPENITVDVTNLMIGDAITVASLPVVEGVEILVDAHEPVVHVAAPRMEEVKAEAAPAAGAAGAAATAATTEAKQPEVIGEKEREARRAEKDKTGDKKGAGDKKGPDKKGA